MIRTSGVQRRWRGVGVVVLCREPTRNLIRYNDIANTAQAYVHLVCHDIGTNVRIHNCGPARVPWAALGQIRRACNGGRLGPTSGLTYVLDQSDGLRYQRQDLRAQDRFSAPAQGSPSRIWRTPSQHGTPPCPCLGV